jgi:CRP-like cAMP-binding protein
MPPPPARSCTCFIVCAMHRSGGQSNNILHAGDYFGERALLLREPRAADVFAETDVTLVAIDREDFENLLGHLRDLLEHNLGMRLLLCVPLLAHLSNDEVRARATFALIRAPARSWCRVAPNHASVSVAACALAGEAQSGLV